MKENSKGRPKEYTRETFDEICARVAKGESLRSILRDDKMPEHVTFYRWLRKDESLCSQYEISKMDRADTYADEITDIADTEEDPARARVRIDARKWISSKLHPRNYGDKMALEHTGKNGKDLKMNAVIFDSRINELMNDKKKDSDEINSLN